MSGGSACDSLFAFISFYEVTYDVLLELAKMILELCSPFTGGRLG